MLPYREGSCPIHHSLTYFNHVKLPSTALLGRIEKPDDPRANFFTNIARVTSGTLGLGGIGVPALRVAAHIGGQYSNRRCVSNPEGKLQPIISFQTQKIPVFTALAQSFVAQAFFNKASSMFTTKSLDHRVRQAVATILKVTLVQHAQRANLELSDRCGAQGLFSVNQLSMMHVGPRHSKEPRSVPH